MYDVCLIFEYKPDLAKAAFYSYLISYIENMPTIKFYLLVITSTPFAASDFLDMLPANVIDFREICWDRIKLGNYPTPRKPEMEIFWHNFAVFLNDSGPGELKNMQHIIDAIAIKKTRVLNIKDIISSPKLWRILLELYRRICPYLPFIDFYYYYTQVFNLFFYACNINLPEAKIYHSFTTGHAILLGFIGKRNFNSYLIINIDGSEIIHKEQKKHMGMRYNMNNDLPIEQMNINKIMEWINIKIFSSIEKLAFNAADRIVTAINKDRIFLKYSYLQQKVEFIPRGIDIQHDIGLSKQHIQGYVQYKVGIEIESMQYKDIEYFIKAIRIVMQQRDNVDLHLIGSAKADNLEKIVSLASSMKLSPRLHFDKALETLNPLHIFITPGSAEITIRNLLNAMWSAIPVITTNLEINKHLVYGNDVEDEEIGDCGLITEYENTRQLADAIIYLLNNDDIRLQMGEAGRRRVEKYYDANKNIQKYLDVYRFFIEDYIQKTNVLLEIGKL